MLNQRPGGILAGPFELEWSFQDSIAGVVARVFTFVATPNRAQSVVTQRVRQNERAMTADFQQELVALLPRLRRFALTLTGDMDLADDLVQQACEKALVKQHLWQVGSRLDSWLYRIIQNLHIDYLRSQGRRSTHLHEDSVDELTDGASKGLPEKQNMLRVVSELIHELPEEQRMVMLLVAVEEHSYREAAEILQIPVGTVMSRLARARSKIIEMLDGPKEQWEGGHNNA